MQKMQVFTCVLHEYLLNKNWLNYSFYFTTGAMFFIFTGFLHVK